MPVQPKAPRFHGRFFVIVGPSNSLATFEFAQQIKRTGLGTLVGQATGGNQRGINGGAFFFLRPPNSKIEVDVPLIAQRPTSGRPDAGMEPDKVVQPSVSDITTGVDSEMVAVRSLVRINLNAASADRLLRPLQNRQMYFYAGAHCPGEIDQRCEFLNPTG